MLNPGGPDQPAVERFGSTYRLGDKVMQIVNDDESCTGPSCTKLAQMWPAIAATRVPCVRAFPSFFYYLRTK